MGDPSLPLAPLEPLFHAPGTPMCAQDATSTSEASETLALTSLASLGSYSGLPDYSNLLHSNVPTSQESEDHQHFLQLQELNPHSTTSSLRLPSLLPPLDMGLNHPSLGEFHFLHQPLENSMAPVNALLEPAKAKSPDSSCEEIKKGTKRRSKSPKAPSAKKAKKAAKVTSTTSSTPDQGQGQIQGQNQPRPVKLELNNNAFVDNPLPRLKLNMRKKRSPDEPLSAAAIAKQRRLAAQSEEERAINRNSANVRERARTKDLNQAYGKLRQTVPRMPSDKLSKIETLKLAVCYLNFLNDTLQQNVTLADGHDLHMSFKMYRLTQGQGSDEGDGSEVNSGVSDEFEVKQEQSSPAYSPGLSVSDGGGFTGSENGL